MPAVTVYFNKQTLFDYWLEIGIFNEASPLRIHIVAAFSSIFWIHFSVASLETICINDNLASVQKKAKESVCHGHDSKFSCESKHWTYTYFIAY